MTRSPLRMLRGIALALLACSGGAAAQLLAPVVEVAPAPPVPPLTDAAERVYAGARPSLLQIRTLVEEAGRQSSIGSGFVVDADGFAITNYHVISQYILEPATYRLEYVRPDGGSGALQVQAIDVANDLAVVRIDGSDLPHLAFDEAAAKDGLARGERVYAMGNPLDLGFTIVEGNWNGLVERSYNERVHFTGAINPGMSGGPAVTGAGRVVGINVAKRLDGDLVSFLVPAGKALTLLQQARTREALDPAQARTEIDRQLLAWQDGFQHALLEQGLRAKRFGPYQAPETDAPWFNCWARTNAEQTPKPRARMNGSTCSSQSSLFVAEDIGSGEAELTHYHLRSDGLNPFQLAAFMSQYYASTTMGGSWSRKRHTPPRCHEEFVAPADAALAPPLRAIWCARAYRDFEGLYDISLTTVTQDRDDEALVSRLGLQGVSYDNALAFAQRFLEGITWAR